MYDDEKNLYHYTYRRDGSETASQPGQSHDAQSAQTEPAPVLTQEPPKKKKHTAGKVVALALVCALLGGTVGGGLVYGVGRMSAG